ncbi:conserved hypothetical protein [Beutenbergia cavernae DSM 12333]|uniref:Winged helix DNA-binding domain-containing protein n=1 Tax=Beutenbergia cavernae (strain ATCC BAA-8 / DSM 12333 / CCUG 43141 / JCM 11478 / NBRC 16432 / NCIMB 13614 / HKI 0122) TaxID=471853 RepID=C5C2A1_BEUC1|nr:winged helix DNA-binding domain-containing protein [Beutenbergia cavernae]ACQ81726.1 conserved hypothetical protein [Beutenbergia cavernae DSM 12333]
MTESPTDAVLDTRTLGRATLARQQLLERAEVAGDDDVVALVARVAGFQAQTPQTWYAGLWNRIADFDPTSVGRMIEDGRLVRIAVMRSTIHLVSPDDAYAWRRALQPVLDSELWQAQHKHLADHDALAIASAAREVLADEALTAKQLSERLASRWPDVAPRTIAYTARNAMPLVQVPPRGVWGKPGATRYRVLHDWVVETAERRGKTPPAWALAREVGDVVSSSCTSWFDRGRPGERPLRAADDSPELRALIRRYLAALGPATVQDVQAFTALTRLAETTDRMDDLVRTRDEKGRELLDVDGAPLPDADTPAPPRVMYDFDNTFLSHADRSRVGDDAVRAAWPRDTNGIVPGAVTLDGTTAGWWRLLRDGRGRPEDAARIEMELVRRPAAGERAALRREVDALLRFLAPGDGAREVRISRAA